MAFLVIAWFLYGNPLSNKPQEVVYEFPDGYEIAVWEWRSPTKLTDTKRVELFDALVEHKVNTVYLNIEDYMNIAEGPEDKREENLKKFLVDLDSFLAQATSRGIEVEALAGGQEWALSSHDYIPPALLNFVIDYNSTREHKLTGIQFDIEYYNLDAYKKNITPYATAYLDLVEELLSILRESKTDTRIGFATSYWLAKEISLSPKIQYNGANKTAGHHLFDILDNYNNSYVVVMAYRNQHDGKGGTVELMKDQLDYIKAYNDKVKVVVGQETTYVEPERITHYGLGRQHLKFSVTKILEAYKDNPALIGVAIHDSQGFLKMKDE